MLFVKLIRLVGEMSYSAVACLEGEGRERVQLPPGVISRGRQMIVILLIMLIRVNNYIYNFVQWIGLDVKMDVKFIFCIFGIFVF